MKHSIFREINPGVKKSERAEKSLKKAQITTLAQAYSHYRPWTEEDTLKVATLEMTDKEIALLLGRSLKSVRSQRQRLYKIGSLTK